MNTIKSNHLKWRTMQLEWIQLQRRRLMELLAISRNSNEIRFELYQKHRHGFPKFKKSTSLQIRLVENLVIKKCSNNTIVMPRYISIRIYFFFSISFHLRHLHLTLQELNNCLTICKVTERLLNGYSILKKHDIDFITCGTN